MKKPRKKLLFASSALATGAMVGLSACGLYGPPEPAPDVYGPPVINEEEYDEPAPVVYGPPVIDDEDINEPVETVYGPPEFFDNDDPSEDVYGPPEP